MAYLQKLLPQTLQSLAFGSIGAGYSTLGTVTHEARIIKIVNTTDANVLISWDGTGSNDNDIISANGFCLYDLTANKVQDDGAFIHKGTVFSVKRVSAAPTVGSVYLVIIYTDVR